MESFIRDLLTDAPALETVARRWDHDRPRGPAVTRFAPSPTGELHLGHVVHALWVWGVASRIGARVVVRMEDHDRSRALPTYEASILRDIEWLGFDLDSESISSLRGHEPSPFRQTDVPDLYAAAVERIAATTGVYGCTCTRGMLPVPGPDGERFYPGTCRGMPRDRVGPTAWRAVMPDSAFDTIDLLHGRLHHDPSHDHGDTTIRDAVGNWTYQLCVVVDDLRHDVNLVIRGDDLLPSTGRQAALAALLGRRERVITLHHPLVVGPDGRKLSKRDRSETVDAMRSRGLTAPEIVNRAFVSSRLGADQRP